MKKAYILIYNPVPSNSPGPLSAATLSAFLNLESKIDDWWNYLPNTFILISEAGQGELGKSITPLLSGHAFFLVRIDINKNYGFLPQAAWDWLQKHIDTPSGNPWDF